MSLLHDLDDGKKHAITEEDFDYFLDVLPPVAMRFPWNGERWHFGFAEGYDHIYAFKKEGGRCYAQKTNLINQHECGVSIEKQQQGLAEKLCQEKEATRAASWIPTWLKIGKANPWIRQASDPAFNTQSFHPCLNDAELLDKLEHGNWCLGQAFFLGDLCVIQQVDGGDEWLTIKQDTPFESMSFGRIIREKGRDAAQAILDRIKAASVKKCRELDY
jgi:hypothetical protein